MPLRGRPLGGVRTYRPRSRGGVTFLLRLAIVVVAVLASVMWLRPGAPEPVIAVWHGVTDEVTYLQLEEYVRGVVAAEMPSHFHVEALKAQAVAARTYAMRRIEENLRLAERPEAHVSSDYRVHQAWSSRDEFLARWSPQEGAARWSLIAEAVDATRGMVLTYGGELVEALYHSTSGGHTEDADRYFRTNLPYLVGVPDPYGAHSPTHETTVAIPVAIVFERLGVHDAVVGATGRAPIEVLSRTPAGRAADVFVGDRTFSGRQVREVLGLRSSWFDVTIDDDVAVFHVRGNGHGVGMSQYGADGMARAGYSFEEILAHYYRGAVLKRRY